MENQLLMIALAFLTGHFLFFFPAGMPVNKENHLLMIALAFLTGNSLFFFWLEIKDAMSGRAPVHHGSTGLKLVK
jgi:hypothetical protein